MIGRLLLPRAVQVKFWNTVRAGVAPTQASHDTGISHTTGQRWFRHAGGVIANAPRPLSDRYLSPAEREEISRGLAKEHSFREISSRSAGDR